MSIPELPSRRCLLLPSLLTGLASFASPAFAQVGVTPNPATYTTLKGAFDAINAGTHTGSIAITITGNTTETAPAVLNASGSGLASYSAVSIQPSGGAPRTISGPIAAGSPLIDFNGADNVTIDGLNAGGNSLTISNTTASTTADTSTIRFIGGATSNTITRATILGSSSSPIATSGGTILFSTDGVTANGNDNNTISNNDIGPAGLNLPSKAILGNGSTTTTAIGNSGIVIHNNNIFDFFGAVSTSAGVATLGGCNTWSITDNRFYQTGTRTWAVGSLHAPIHIESPTATSGAQGFTITGNNVGFASSTQTGTYTLTGSGNGAKFTGILFNGIPTGTTTTVSNNTVAGIQMTGVTSGGTSISTPFTAIFFREGVGITNGNTIGSQSATGSLTFSTTTTSTTDVYGLFNFSSNVWTADNNTVGGLSVTNLGASGSFLVYGMRALTTSLTPWTATGNIVGGTVPNSIQLSATGTGSQVAGMFSGSVPVVLTSNVVRNMTTNVGTSNGNGASMAGILIWATQNHTVTQNTISNLTNTNPTAASTVTGIQFNSASASVVSRNRISSLTAATNSGSAEVSGIRVASGTTIFRNNMIALGAGIPNAIGLAAGNGNVTGINGILSTLGNDSFFHNSVYIGGTAATGTGASYAFNSTQASGTRSFRDNIFYNGRANTGATGKHYAVKINGTSPNPAGLTLDNNLYFADGTGGVFGFYNSGDVTSLAAWRIAVGQDLGSFLGNPQFLDPANATPDLHVHPVNATIAEGNGADVGVTDDFDGQTRSGLTPVDIGADAGNFSGADLTPPQIAYTPLGNTSSTSNRTLTSAITDLGSGVPTAGIGLPRIYYRRGNVGGFASTQATSGGGGSYTFTIDYSLVTGGTVALGDTIHYYVVAQDGAPTPNVGARPSAGAGGFSFDPPAAAQPPTTRDSYQIVQPISGTKTVCASGCDYSTLTGATGAFDAINTRAVTGNLELQIAGDLTVGEDGVTALNAFNEHPEGSDFTLRIYPTGVARAITGSSNSALVKLRGASRVTIDGSIGGVGTDRSLTISNNNVTTPGVVLFGSVGTTPIRDGILRNCVLVNGVDSSSAVVISDATSPGTAGRFADITIQNNDIRRASVGVFAHGGTTPQGGSNLVYTQNTLTGLGANAIRATGLYMQGVDGATITGNNIGNISGASGEDKIGIWLGAGTIHASVGGNTISEIAYTGTGAFGAIGIHVTSNVANTGIVLFANGVSNVSGSGGEVGSLVRGIAIQGPTSDLTIERNDIRGITNTSPGTYGAYGIDVSGGNNVTVRNNFVSGVSFDMTGGNAFSTTFGVFGIRIGAGTGHQIYNNSVHLYGSLPGTAANSLLTSAFGLVQASSTGVDVRNNIFANDITGGTTSIAHVSAYLPPGGTSAMNLTWNNNAYYFGTDPTRQGAGQAGTIAGTNFFGTLAALTTYTGTLSPAGTNDNASVESTGAVPFVSAGDLHLQPSSTLVSLGVPLAGVTHDIDFELRPISAPDLGADELVAPADLAISKTDGATSVVRGGSTIYTIAASNAGPNPVTGSTVTDTFPDGISSCSTTCVGAGGGTCTAGPFAGNISDTVNLPVGGTVTYTSACSVSVSAPSPLVNTATVAAPPGMFDPAGANNAASDSNLVTDSADLSITKTDGSASEVPGTPVTYTIVASNAGPSAVTGATVTDNFVGTLSGCSTTCVGAGGGSCPGGPVAGNINASVNLPVGASVTFNATCNISPAATVTLVNTASIASATSDPSPGNNTATDTDTLTPLADVAILKTDGATTEVVGTPVTYTITVSNAGPSNASNVTVADNFVAALTGCSTTCVASGGATCTNVAVVGNLNDTASVPVGGAATYTVSCNIAPTAFGTLVNTATATVNGPANDPTTANNTSTDTDTLNQIFRDGFEIGTTANWSSTVPLSDFELYATAEVAEATTEVSVPYDFAALRSGRELGEMAIVELVSADYQPLARLMARRVDSSSPIELRLEVLSGAKSDWVTAPAGTESIRLDWVAADPASFGSIDTTLDGLLTVWIDGFDPAAAPAKVRLFRERTNR